MGTIADRYWQVGEQLVIGATEKAGATSIGHACIRCRKFTPEQVLQRGFRIRLYLRHPITRFASVFAYFAPNDNFPIQPSRAAYKLAEHPTLEQFTDAVLDGMDNEHWRPQLAQHLPIDELYRFENIDETWFEKYTLGHHNKGRIPKPEIIHRLADLEEFYREDLDAWQQC